MRIGGRLALLAVLAVAFQIAVVTPAQAGIAFLKAFDTTSVGQLHGPWGIATDDHGNVYVADTGAHRIVKFNAAGDPVTPSPGLPGYYRILTVTRYESTYDLALAEAYEGTWNTDSVYIPKTPGPVAPGRILCVSYEPTTDYDLKASYVQVQYVFWLRRGVRQDNFTATDKVWDAWKFRLLNAGLNGWYQFSAGPPAVYKKTRLTRANSDGRYEPVTDPVPLDASGKPVPSDVKVGNAGSAPVANPTLLDSKLIETGSLSTTFLKYYKYKGAAFRGLNLFLAGATT